MTNETRLLDEFIAARIEYRERYAALQAAIDRHTREGRLIQYGDLPEFAPAEISQKAFWGAAIAYADHIITVRAREHDGG